MKSFTFKRFGFFLIFIRKNKYINKLDGNFHLPPAKRPLSLLKTAIP